MTQAGNERAQAMQAPQGSVIGILLEQHAAIRDLFGMVNEAEGGRRRQRFDDLRQLLAVHEAGEQAVLRPVTREIAGDAVAEARIREETAAGEAIAALEKMEVDSPEFASAFADFERAVSDHAGREEDQEFPALLGERSPEVLEELGRMLVAGQAEESARQQSGHGDVGDCSPFAELLAHARQAFAGDWPAPLRDGSDRTLAGVDGDLGPVA